MDLGKNGKKYQTHATPPGYRPAPWTFPPGIGQQGPGRIASRPGYLPLPWTFPPGMGQAFHSAGRPQSWRPDGWTFRAGMGAPPATPATPTMVAPAPAAGTNGIHQAAWIALILFLVAGRKQRRG